jgi:hypothetical protein
MLPENNYFFYLYLSSRHPVQEVWIEALRGQDFYITHNDETIKM